MIGDGQVSLGPTIVKPNAKKVRRLVDGKVVVGFAGATADALSLMDKLETQLEQYPNHLMRSCVEMAKMWRTDKILRNLEAQMIAMDKDVSLLVTGTGDVLESNDGILGIGSGSAYAIAAARALMTVDGLSAKEIALRSMKIAADICVYTNDNFVIEEMTSDTEPEDKRTK